LFPIIEVGREFAGVEPVLARPFGLRPLEAATGGGARLGAAGAGGGGALSTSFKLTVSAIPHSTCRHTSWQVPIPLDHS
jgi:hypothetical protein